MTNGEAKALAAEYNALLAKGQGMWTELKKMAERCNDIKLIMTSNNVPFDEIALLFGSDMELDLVGDDDARASS